MNGYGANNVSNVRCNGGKNPDVKKDSTFTCQAAVNGTERQITAVIVDDAGTYADRLAALKKRLLDVYEDRLLSWIAI